jgi:hypothetical protein
MHPAQADLPPCPENSKVTMKHRSLPEKTPCDFSTHDSPYERGAFSPRSANIVHLLRSSTRVRRILCEVNKYLTKQKKSREGYICTIVTFALKLLIMLLFTPCTHFTRAPYKIDQSGEMVTRGQIAQLGKPQSIHHFGWR